MTKQEYQEKISQLKKWIYVDKENIVVYEALK